MNELIDFKDNDVFNNPYTYKCIVIGDSSIGKTTMLGVLENGIFNNKIQSTIGMGFAFKTISLIEYKQTVRLQIWDTAGQEKYKSISKQYLRDAFIAFLVYDVTNRNSWDNLEQWKENILNVKVYKSIPIIVLVGTKSDLKRVISNQEIKDRKNKWNCKSYIISSKQQSSKHIIDEMFYIAAEDLHKNLVKNHINGFELPSGIYKNVKKLTETENNFCCF